MLIAEAATKLATEMPAAPVEAFAQAIQANPAKAPAVQGIPHLHYRSLAAEFIDLWQTRAASVSPEAVAQALRTATHGETVHREEQTVELVWTGSSTKGQGFRRTEQAILQVLDSAQEQITLVSYAVYRIPNVCGALVRAARRGVRIKVIVETPEKLEGESEHSTLRALGNDVVPSVATRRISRVLPSSRRRHTGLPAMATPTSLPSWAAPRANLPPTLGLLCRWFWATDWLASRR